MKHIVNKNFAILIACISLIAACNKDYQDFTQINTVDLSKKTMIKIINATTGATRNYAYSPELFAPVSGAAFSYGGTFPTLNSYFAIKPGDNNIIIKDTLATSTQIPLAIATFYEPGKRYSIFTYDTTTSIKYKMVIDDIVIPTDSTARIRFANFVRSGSVIPNLDIYSRNLGTNIFSNVAVTDVTSFISYASKVQDSIYIRATGTTTNLIGTSITPEQRRNYTLVFRGRYDATGTATVPRALTFFTNN